MIRVLLIDENEIDSSILINTIKKINAFEVTVNSTSSFNEAKSLLAKHSFNILISELYFKEYAVKDVIKTLYQDFSNLPLIIATNHIELKHYLNFHLTADILEKKGITPLLLEKSLQMAYQKFNFKIEKKKMLAELEEKNKRIKRVDKQIEELAYTLSHDLRGPIGSILGLSDLINGATDDLEEIKSFNHLIHTSAFQLNELLNQLLEILLSSQNIYQTSQPLNIGNEVASVIKKLKRLYPDVTFKLEANFNSEKFEFSQRALQFLLFNLLSNAVKFRSERRPLIIKVETKLVTDEFFCISVQDNGTGMDMEAVKPRIFKIFKRFHPHIEGKGLGLYAVKTMLDELGGKLEVNSTLNEGTEFKAYLKPIEDYEM